jgi:hypothetical protein
VIRNVAIHLASEQPLLADLYSAPNPSDYGLVCTNVRMMDGKRPMFIDAITSTFFFPYHLVRFLEIPPEELARHQASGGGAPGSAAGESMDYASGGEERLPVVVGGPDDGADAEGIENLEIELDIDEDFLQRVRDI